MQTRGYAAQAPDLPLAPFTFARRGLGDRDVHVAIDFCGICHSDIHFARNEWGFTTYPAVPGHEIIGHVVAAGPSAMRFRPGCSEMFGMRCSGNLSQLSANAQPFERLRPIFCASPTDIW